MLGVRKIDHTHARRVALPARAPDGHEWQPLRPAERGHCNLGYDLIARINHEVETGHPEQLPDIFLVHKLIDGPDLAGRVDLGNALGQRADLCLPKCRVERLDLAIHVGLGDMVQIDQGQMTHAAACERLDRPGPHASDANHADVSPSKALHGGLSEQARDAAETPGIVRLAGRVRWRE